MHIFYLKLDFFLVWKQMFPISISADFLDPNTFNLLTFCITLLAWTEKISLKLLG